MPHLLLAVLVLLAAPATGLAADAVIAAVGRDGAPVVRDPTLAFAIATAALCVALYLVHRLVNRQVR